MTISCCIRSGCRNIIANKRYQLCKIHNWERMNPGKKYFDEMVRKNGLILDRMKKKQLLKPKKVYKKKIKFRTEKRSKEERKYSIAREEHLKEFPFCQVCLDKNIETIATECHHKKGRDGDLLFNKKFFLSVCHIHHEYIGNHLEWALENNYSILRTTT